jgi:GNAT superfamily N-acetyltransferase
MIRIAKKYDIPMIVEIHSRSLSDDYLPKLGKQVLHGFYDSVVNDITIVIFIEKEIITGFLAVALHPINLKKIFFQYYKIITKSILMQPNLWAQTLWLALYSREGNYYPEISFFAVKEEYQARGVGSQLIEWVCNYLKKRGHKSLYVKTEATNVKTNEFYRKNNFEMVVVEKRFNRIFNVYVREKL